MILAWSRIYEGLSGLDLEHIVEGGGGGRGGGGSKQTRMKLFHSLIAAR